MLVCAAYARSGLGELALRAAEVGYGLRAERPTQGFNLLARAMRAEHPGLLFACAAAAGEVDRLTDVDSRLFVGLPVQPSA